MNKRQLPILIGIFVVLLLLLTNPGIEEHKAVIKGKFMEVAQKEMKTKASDAGGLESLGMMLGTTLAEGLINNMVSRDNYLLFSLTKVTFDGESKIIGVGVLGNIFLTGKVDDLKK